MVKKQEISYLTNLPLRIVSTSSIVLQILLLKESAPLNDVLTKPSRPINDKFVYIPQIS